MFQKKATARTRIATCLHWTRVGRGLNWMTLENLLIEPIDLMSSHSAWNLRLRGINPFKSTHVSHIGLHIGLGRPYGLFNS